MMAPWPAAFFPLAYLIALIAFSFEPNSNQTMAAPTAPPPRAPPVACEIHELPLPLVAGSGSGVATIVGMVGWLAGTGTIAATARCGCVTALAAAKGMAVFGPSAARSSALTSSQSTTPSPVGLLRPGLATNLVTGLAEADAGSDAKGDAVIGLGVSA